MKESLSGHSIRTWSGHGTQAGCPSSSAVPLVPGLRFVSALVVCAVVCVLQTASPALSQSGNQSRLCMAPYWGGVLAGRTRTEVFIKLFGAASRSLVHGEGALLYRNPDRSRLVVAKFLDNVAISVDVWDNASYAPRGMDTPAQSSWIDSNEGIGRWGLVNIGATPEAVVRAMGKPQAVNASDELTVWTYESSCSCELASGFTVRFKAGRLVSFGVWQDAG